MKRRRAFTLVELLVVIGIMGIMAALIIPAFTSLGGSKDFARAAYDIQGLIEQARAFAIGNNTYVYLGFAELDASKSASANPQVTGTGRVAVVAVATKDGMRDYDPSAAVSGDPKTNATWAQSYGANGANLIAVGKLRIFNNLHIAASLAPPPATGEMARRTVKIPWRVGEPTFVSMTPFSWPLGKAINGGQYTFTKVIRFNPQGSPFLEYSNDPSKPSVPGELMEIGLQPTHGNVAPPKPTDPNLGNQIAIFINGVTGGSRMYRP
jgi:prepilin-type N-terminal cleavage/methylation domain-containing protein